MSQGENAKKTPVPKDPNKLSLRQKKKFTPKQLIGIALSREKSDKFKQELQREHGLVSIYWNHTGGYSKFLQQDEQLSIQNSAQKYKVSDYLATMLKKHYQTTMVREFIKEYSKQAPLEGVDRLHVTTTGDPRLGGCCPELSQTSGRTNNTISASPVR